MLAASPQTPSARAPAPKPTRAPCRRPQRCRSRQPAAATSSAHVEIEMAPPRERDDTTKPQTPHNLDLLGGLQRSEGLDITAGGVAALGGHAHAKGAADPQHASMRSDETSRSASRIADEVRVLDATARSDVSGPRRPVLGHQQDPPLVSASPASSATSPQRPADWQAVRRNAATVASRGPFYHSDEDDAPISSPPKRMKAAQKQAPSKDVVAPAPERLAAHSKKSIPKPKSRKPKRRLPVSGLALAPAVYIHADSDEAADESNDLFAPYHSAEDAIEDVNSSLASIGTEVSPLGSAAKPKRPPRKSFSTLRRKMRLPKSPIHDALDLSRFRMPKKRSKRVAFQVQQSISDGFSKSEMLIPPRPPKKRPGMKLELASSSQGLAIVTGKLPTPEFPRAESDSNFTTFNGFASSPAQIHNAPMEDSPNFRRSLSSRGLPSTQPHDEEEHVADAITPLVTPRKTTLDPEIAMQFLRITAPAPASCSSGTDEDEDEDEESLQDYLTRPGQAARMRTRGEWMEVQDDIDDEVILESVPGYMNLVRRFLQLIHMVDNRHGHYGNKPGGPASAADVEHYHNEVLLVPRSETEEESPSRPRNSRRRSQVTVNMDTTGYFAAAQRRLTSNQSPARAASRETPREGSDDGGDEDLFELQQQSLDQICGPTNPPSLRLAEGAAHPFAVSPQRNPPPRREYPAKATDLRTLVRRTSRDFGTSSSPVRRMQSLPFVPPFRQS
ncbi:hypothetical protein K490DRAFT_60236 [Saccharata proteae CBS 121410]|uniref:Uncharacterized protein n=1 Tax=Saccharata proteae CBS 121410 TaxID=1314787 RepID=A0A9P4HQF5_9PEZI|nr:hypothetical protein K490DRAFT_60236 [Saccharata proteae CBS 121410]